METNLDLKSIGAVSTPINFQLVSLNLFEDNRFFQVPT